MAIDADLQVPGEATTANELWFDALVRHQIFVLRASGSLRNEMIALLNATERDVANRIRARLPAGGSLTPQQLRRAQVLIKELREIRGAAHDQIETLLLAAMTTFVVNEAKFVKVAFETSVPVQVDAKLPAKKTLTALVRNIPFEGLTLRQWARNMRAADLRRIDQQIRIGIVQGEDGGQIARRVVGTRALRGRDGVTQISRGDAAIISRTASIHFSNSAREEFLSANSEFFTEELYVATLDGVTCWSPSSLITMASGSVKTIGDVEVGDLVLGGVSGRPSRVEGVHREVSGSSVAMYNQEGYIGDTTHGHRILTPSGWRTAQDLCLHADVPEREVVRRGLEGPTETTEGACGEQQESGDLERDPGPRDSRPGGVALCRRIPPSSGTGDRGDSSSRDFSSEGIQHDSRRGRRSRAGSRNAESCSCEGWTDLQEQDDTRTEICYCEACAIVMDRGVDAQDDREEDQAESRHHGRGEGDTKSRAKSKSRQVYEAEVAGPRVSGAPRGSNGETRSPSEIEGEWCEGHCCDHSGGLAAETGEVTTLGFAEMVRETRVWGYEQDRPTEIVSISLSGDPTYVVGGLIVHNTPICRSLDGRRFPVGEGPMPPIHMGCRSLRVAIILQEALGRRPTKPTTERLLVREFTRTRGITGVGRRADLPFGTKGAFDTFSRRRVREMIGTVPAKVTYPEWLRKQSVLFQDDVLGKTKGRLFRRGGLPLTKFVNRRGDEIPLSQLAVSDASAFRAAGLDPGDFR